MFFGSCVHIFFFNITELEEEASIPPAKTLQLSEPLVRYCVCMLESYGEDYKVIIVDPL